VAAIGDKYVLTLRADDSTQDPVGNNPMYNVFAYEATNGSPNANDLFSTFNANVAPKIAAIVGTSTTLHNIDVINLDDASDFDLNAIVLAGTRGGDWLPMFTSWTFKYNRGVRGIHNGRKAFGVISETDQINGEPAVGINAALNALAVQLGAVLVGASGDYTPKIWRRAGTYQVGGVPTVFPDTFYPLVGVTFDRVSTQNSRKR